MYPSKVLLKSNKEFVHEHITYKTLFVLKQILCFIKDSHYDFNAMSLITLQQQWNSRQINNTCELNLMLGYLLKK